MQSWSTTAPWFTITPCRTDTGPASMLLRSEKCTLSTPGTSIPPLPMNHRYRLWSCPTTVQHHATNIVPADRHMKSTPRDACTLFRHGYGKPEKVLPCKSGSPSMTSNPDNLSTD